jgi:hypothetical protein
MTKFSAGDGGAGGETHIKIGKFTVRQAVSSRCGCEGTRWFKRSLSLGFLGGRQEESEGVYCFPASVAGS